MRDAPHRPVTPAPGRHCRPRTTVRRDSDRVIDEIEHRAARMPYGEPGRARRLSGRPRERPGRGAPGARALHGRARRDPPAGGGRRDAVGPRHRGGLGRSSRPSSSTRRPAPTRSNLFIPMSMAQRRVVLVGDHRQLPHLLEPDVERGDRRGRGEGRSAQGGWRRREGQPLRAALAPAPAARREGRHPTHGDARHPVPHAPGAGRSGEPDVLRAARRRGDRVRAPRRRSSRTRCLVT